MILIALFVSCIYDTGDMQNSYCRGVCDVNKMVAANDPEYTIKVERDTLGRMVGPATISCLCVSYDKEDANYITFDINIESKKEQQSTLEKP